MKTRVLEQKIAEIEEEILDNQVAETSDEYIKLLFVSNKDKALALLYKRYYAILCSHASRYVVSKEVAEDIVSDIFLEFHLQELYLSIHSSFRAYLFRSVRNRAFDHAKAEIRHKNISLDGAYYVAADAEFSPDAVMQFEEFRHDLERAINEMPMKRREIYLLHKFEGFKSLEIAQQLNVSIRTVETHIYQGSKDIKEFIQKKWQLF